MSAPDTPLAAWSRLLPPSRLGAAEAACRRRLHRGQVPLSFSLGPHTLSAAVASPREIVLAGALTARLPVRIGDSLGQLGLSSALVRLLLDLLGPGLPPNHPDLDLLLEAALTPPLEALERLLGHSITLLPAAEKLPADLQVLGLRVSRNGVPLGLAVLRLGMAEAILLADALNRLPSRPTNLDRLPLDVAVAAGSAWLRLGMLGQLRPGDIILSDETHPEGTVRIVVAGQRGMTARKAGKGYQIITAATGPSQEPTAMEETQEKPAEAATLDDLAVQVVFEVARLDLPLGELQKMRPGYVLELDRPATLTVDLAVRGRIVGKAELVQVENTLGARITRLFEHE